MEDSRIITFDTQGNEKQKLAAKYWIDDSVEEILYGGGKGGGKTFLGVNLTFGDAFLYPGTHYFIARKKLKDLRQFTIPSIHEVFETWNIDSNMYRYNGQDAVFELYNKSRVYLLEAKYMPSDPLFERFGSMQMTRGWIEEAGEFETPAYKNLKVSIGRWKNEEYDLAKKLLMTANPKKNFLYKLFYLALKNNSIEDWRKFIQALPYDNKKLPKGYIENLERTLSGIEKKRLLLGEWEYDDDPEALCDYEKILQIFKNDHLHNGEKYITADIARFGSDKAVIIVWNGWNVEEVYTYETSATTKIQALINHLRKKHQIPASNCIADEDGVGGGVVDNCKINGFVNNSRPIKEDGEQKNYYNLQNQCIYKLAERINSNGINIRAEISDKTKDEIVEELEQIKSDNDEFKKLKTKSKAYIKDRIGRSPDYRDCLMMREWFDLQPKRPSFSFYY